MLLEREPIVACSRSRLRDGVHTLKILQAPACAEGRCCTLIPDCSARKSFSMFITTEALESLARSELSLASLSPTQLDVLVPSSMAWRVRLSVSARNFEISFDCREGLAVLENISGRWTQLHGYVGASISGGPPFLMKQGVMFIKACLSSPLGYYSKLPVV